MATDLRVVISAIHGAGDIERMGDLALHVAQAARRRHPRLVLLTEVVPYFAEMGKIASAPARKAAEVMRSRDVEMAGTLEADDDAMDDLHRHLFSVLMAPSWSHGVGPAIDVTLLGRFYERYADHAVTVARRVVYVVTGRMPARWRSDRADGPARPSPAPRATVRAARADVHGSGANPAGCVRRPAGRPAAGREDRRR